MINLPSNYGIKHHKLSLENGGHWRPNTEQDPAGEDPIHMMTDAIHTVCQLCLRRALAMEK